MELVSGCSVEELSAMHWDQHEAFPQLGNSSILLSQGASQLLNLLSEDLDIQYNVEVSTQFLFFSLSLLIVDDS